VQRELRPLSQYALFDLGVDSLLEPICRGHNFRVAQYDPDKLATAHAPGRHRYLICRAALEADVIVSLPKLKTHKKAGLTGALKNLVGLNGDKEFLPHHRLGGSGMGGDCYPGASRIRHLAERLLDGANRRIGTPRYRLWAEAARLLWLFTPDRHDGAELDGSWAGNDTVWRMVLDLNRIALYGRADGTMADQRQRVLLSLTDAIVAGQGDGPLAPTPLWLGAITFSACAPAAERANAALLRLNAEAIPLLAHAGDRFRWPIAAPSSAELRARDRVLLPEALALDHGASACAPRGWRGQVELDLAEEAAS
jgi:hypothetical protein